MHDNFVFSNTLHFERQSCIGHVLQFSVQASADLCEAHEELLPRYRRIGLMGSAIFEAACNECYVVFRYCNSVCTCDVREIVHMTTGFQVFQFHHVFPSSLLFVDSSHVFRLSLSQLLFINILLLRSL